MHRRSFLRFLSAAPLAGVAAVALPARADEQTATLTLKADMSEVNAHLHELTEAVKQGIMSPYQAHKMMMHDFKAMEVRSIRS